MLLYLRQLFREMILAASVRVRLPECNSLNVTDNKHRKREMAEAKEILLFFRKSYFSSLQWRWTRWIVMQWPSGCTLPPGKHSSGYLNPSPLSMAGHKLRYVQAWHGLVHHSNSTLQVCGSNRRTRNQQDLAARSRFISFDSPLYK